MKTVILSWLQNDGNGVPLALKMTRASGQNVGESCFLVFREPPSSIILKDGDSTAAADASTV